MLLLRTHQNRWIARHHRHTPAIGRITRIDSNGLQACFRTEAWQEGDDERILLKDADALEVAFALLLAYTTRALHRPPFLRASTTLLHLPAPRAIVTGSLAPRPY